MIRSLAKTVFACAYSWSGNLRPHVPRAAARLPFIAGYHRVVRDFDQSSQNSIPSMLISTATFEKHLDWIAGRFDIVTLDELGERLESGVPSRRPAAAITFDDGYADTYLNAFPILQRKGIPAAIFVVTGLSGTSNAPIYDLLFSLLRRQSKSVPLTTVVSGLLRDLGLDCARLANLKHARDEEFAVLTWLLDSFEYSDLVKIAAALEQRAGSVKSDLEEMMPLTWDMLREMSDAGITIGSHTTKHVLLTNESPSIVAAELIESKRVIEESLKRPVRHFAYPNGSFNESVVEAVHTAGYRFAYGICLSRDARFPLLTIPRTVLWERACVNVFGQFSPSIMQCQTQNVFESRRFCIHDHGVQAA